jgi:hypothetical protein
MTSSRTCGFPTESDVLAALNRHCRCAVVDDAALALQLETQLAEPGLFRTIRDSHPHLFSPTAVFIAREDIERMRRLIQAIEQVVATPAYRARVLGWADPIAAVDPASPGAFLGYDFHLGANGSAGGPKLIEINTNAGGGLLNAALARAARACCAETEHMAIGAPDPEKLEEAFIEMFRREWHAQRPYAPLRSIAIVDDDPGAQYLYPEFRLFAALFERAGLQVTIADAAALTLRDGRLHSGALPIDLVYNRLTDFAFTDPRHAALRETYREGAVAVTPHPRAYALYADKRNLSLLTDPAFLDSLGLPTDVARTLLNDIPRTVPVDPAEAEKFWAQRKQWFFKPATGFGSRAAYRGDKLTRRVFEEIVKGGYVAQARVDPAERAHLQADVAPFKFDLRCYAYAGEIQLLAARLYQGQTTNFRTPGGGFAPVFYLAR